MMLIEDLNKCAASIREFAAQNISESGNTENLDEYVSLKQVEKLIISHAKSKNGQYYISEKKYNIILNILMNMIYGVGLAKLAAADKIECAWDDATNSMIFWSKNNSI